MSFFSKKDNDELFYLLESDDSYESTFNPDYKQNRAHALTPEELINFSEDNTTVSPTNALEALKKRMSKSIEKETEKVEETEAVVETQKPIKNKATENSTQLKSEPSSKDEDKISLLEKCRPYIIDDKGNDSAMQSAPTYRLESVAEILESQSKKTLDKLSEKYDISFDDLGKYGTKDQKEEHIIEEKTEINNQPEEREVFEDIISSTRAITDVQTNVSVISDIDTAETFIKPQATTDSNTATIKFTLVTDSDNTSRISVSSQTRPIDFTDEFTGIAENSPNSKENEVKLEQSEFEEYTPTDEFSDENDTKHFLKILSIKNRSCFLKTVFSIVITLILAIFKLPFMLEIMLAQTKVTGIITSVLLGIIILINWDIVLSIPKLVNRKQTPDIFAFTSSITVLAYAITAILNNEIALDLILLCAMILSFRALTSFFNSSQILASFRQISGTNPKRAVRLIDDKAITFAMAKNSIEGDVLVAAPQRTKHINGFMKHSTFGVSLSGRLPIISLLSIILSIAVGFACTSYFDGAIYGLFSAACVQCFAALPVIFFIDNLPLYSAAKKLSKFGAMLAGKTGAERIENANAVVFSSEDLFPSGTVSLHQMKILSENNVDDTIIRAASLTDALNSPLSTIFKKIAGTGGEVILPKSDTVKYEDRMGISGWVDNKLLFIGNRALMEAHGITVPSLEIDRKILRQGFFPVYVASEDKACALLIVQYNVRPEIARELRRISALGVTMLINNSDPNMTEEMICDYMGLYEDSVKVMSAAGCHMYKNTVTSADSVLAPAAYKGNPIGLAAIINSSSRIKKSNILLTVLYVIFAVLGAVLFAYMSFDGSGTLTSGLSVLLYSLGCTIISYILYLTQKP